MLTILALDRCLRFVRIWRNRGRGGLYGVGEGGDRAVGGAFERGREVGMSRGGVGGGKGEGRGGSVLG